MVPGHQEGVQEPGLVLRACRAAPPRTHTAAPHARARRQNKDTDSPFYDFKFALKAFDLDHQNLLPHQMVNHFVGNTALTRKVR